MKTIKIKVNPKSSFITFPKGDMIFSYFTYLLFLEKNYILEDYLENENPKIIFSDFLPNGYFAKPTLPLKSFNVEDGDKKDFRKKEWIKIENLQNGKLEKCEEIEFFKEDSIIRNQLNRKTFTTDDNFAPYSTNEIIFTYEPVFYCMYDETIFEEKYILEILTKMGKNGFGKKSTIGKGQFEIKKDENFEGFKKIETDYYLTLSPTILNSSKIKRSFYSTFNRFGKYSNSNTPFKKPILMAQSSAVLELEAKKEFIGKSINNGIKNISFLQGYSILVPFKFDGRGV
jgi:CRISPR-associated protein Csm4